MTSSISKPFDHLIDVLLPTGGFVVALYDFYIDESYGGDSMILAIGGYLIRSDQAKIMAAAWNEVLTRYSVPYFHMVDVAHCTENHCAEIYRHLGPTGCDKLAREMIELVKTHTARGFVSLMNPNLFRPPAVPYVWGHQECLTAVTAFASNIDPACKVGFIFESGHKHGQLALQTITKDFQEGKIEGTDDVGQFLNPVAPIAFSTKTGNCLLQAADILVWQARKYCEDKIKKKRGVRGDFRSLVSERHVFTYILSNSPNLTIHVDGQDRNQLLDAKPHLPWTGRDIFLEAMFVDPVIRPRLKVRYRTIEL